jgi:hypothetical protein
VDVMDWFRSLVVPISVVRIFANWRAGRRLPPGGRGGDVLSPALAFLGAIGVEVVIAVLVEAGVPLLPAFACSVLGWLLLRRLGRRQGGAPVET